MLRRAIGIFVVVAAILVVVQAFFAAPVTVERHAASVPAVRTAPSRSHHAASSHDAWSADAAIPVATSSRAVPHALRRAPANVRSTLERIAVAGSAPIETTSRVPFASRGGSRASLIASTGSVSSLRC